MLYIIIQSIHAAVEEFNFGIQRESMVALESEVKLFDTCDTKEANDLRDNVARIGEQLREPLQNENRTAKLEEFLELINRTLELVNNPHGGPLKWTVPGKKCAGHNESKTLEYVADAEKFGAAKKQELVKDKTVGKSNVDIPDPNHGARWEIAYASMFTFWTWIIPPLGAVIASDLRKKYDSITYTVTWTYYHNVGVQCDRLVDSIQRDTAELQRALLGLKKDAKDFQLQDRVDDLKEKNRRLEDEVAILRKQVEISNKKKPIVI